MKSSRVQAAANKERVVQLGSERFREFGYDGIGVADLMREAGQTHGAFYGHFRSKESFLSQTNRAGFEQMLQNWHDAGLALSDDNNVPMLQGLVAAYLSDAHRDNPAQGCVVAALGANACRQGVSVRETMTVGVESTLELIGKHAPGATAKKRREHAVFVFSSLVGAITLARAVADPALSTEIMKSTARRLLSTLTSRPEPTA